MTGIESTLSTPVTVVGESRTTVTTEDLETLPYAERRVEIDCASGDGYAANWRGVPVRALLERAGAPDDATHAIVEARDGYRVCVGIADGLSGLLALVRDGRPLSETADYETRFVADGVDGARTVKDVAIVRAVALAPGDDPERYEDLRLNARDGEP